MDMAMNQRMSFRSFSAIVPYMVFCVATFECAQVMGAEVPATRRPSLSFNRQCKRLASDVSETNSAKLIPPRASPATPLQQPPHPPLARSRGEEGTVVMDLFVTETGEVAEVYLAISSGYAELDSAAMQGTERWKLSPATLDGIPVCMWGKYAVRFSLPTGDQQENVVPPFGGVGGRTSGQDRQAD